MKVYRILGAGLVAFASVGLDAGALQEPPPTPAHIEAGRRIYEREKCATCHQINGHGNSRFPLDGVGAKLSAKDLRRWITETARMEDALPKLPAIRMSAKKYRLTDVELDALVAYLRSLSTQRLRDE